MLLLSESLPRSGKARRLLMGLYAKDHGKILFRSFTCNHRPHLIGCSNRRALKNAGMDVTLAGRYANRTRRRSRQTLQPKSDTVGSTNKKAYHATYI